MVNFKGCIVGFSQIKLDSLMSAQVITSAKCYINLINLRKLDLRHKGNLLLSSQSYTSLFRQTGIDIGKAIN